MQIVDRADGRVLVDLPDELGAKLSDVAEDVQSFQVTELFLELAAQEGMDPEDLSRLRQELERSPTLVVGMDKERGEDPSLVLEGLVVDRGGQPLAGLALTFLDNSSDEALAWTFSDPEGRYRLAVVSPSSWSAVEILVAARGGLLLASFEMDRPSQKLESLEPLLIATVCGQVLTESGEPLVGGRVEALHTWSVLDENGRFRLPVQSLSEPLDLEVFASTGEPLGGYWRVAGLPSQEEEASDPRDLGVHRVPAPNPDWLESSLPLLAADEPRALPYPGVSEFPLQ